MEFKKDIFSRLISNLLIFSITFFFFSSYAEADSINPNERLIERISKDYTNKFCNSIAFGLSQESAMTFANKENNQIFRKKKGFDNLNKDLLANNIANSVVDNCGYILNLKSEKDIKEFEKDYISMNNFSNKLN